MKESEPTNISEPTSTVVAPDGPREGRWSSETVGFCAALASAFFYSVSLFSLRSLTEYTEISPDWSIAIKELTTVACVLPFILIQWARGRWKFPGMKTFGILLAAGLSCQLFGSRPNLIAYSAIGIALAVPLVQAIQLVGTTLVGAIWLKEKVTKIKIASVATLIAAVCFLSSSQNGGDGQIAGQSMRIGLGLLCVFSAGLGYSGQLSLMRKVLRPREGAIRTPTSLGLVMITGVGFILCSTHLTVERGFGAFFEPPPICWAYVLTSGFANLIGFYFQIESLRRLYVSKSALLAASQTLLLALLGIAFFGEPINAAVVAGLILATVGVGLSGFSK